MEWGYAGTNSSDGGGAPAYQIANAFIDMDTPLYPFRKEDNSWYTSNDVTDIEELGYSYFDKGSLEPFVPKPKLVGAPDHSVLGSPPSPANVIRVSGVNRLRHEGSFVVRTYVRKGDKEYEVGMDPVLSRWKVQGCLNCQNHLEVKSYVPIHQEFLDALGVDKLDDKGIVVEARVQTHGTSTQRLAATPSDNQPPKPMVEIL